MSALAGTYLIRLQVQTFVKISECGQKTSISFKMGNLIVRTTENFLYPDVSPVPYGETTFDSHLGFEGKREKRVMKISEQELRAMKIPKSQWDFCAHTLKDVEKCRYENFPFVWRCKEEVHAASMCNYDDWIIRMKEYERERRLLHRKKRLEEKANAAAA